LKIFNNFHLVKLCIEPNLFSVSCRHLFHMIWIYFAKCCEAVTFFLRIRIRGSIPLNCGFGSVSLLQRL
jgi:homoserine kinase